MIISKLRDKRSRNIFIGNFSCEEIWEMHNTVKLPVLDLKEVKSVIYNLDELIIYLAKSKDIVILRNQPNEEFVEKLKELSIELPEIVTPQIDSMNKSVSELILCDKKLLNLLKKFVIHNKAKDVKTYLIPYGITKYEERIADIISVQIVSNYLLCSQLNNKLALRYYVKQLNMAFPETTICNGVHDLKSKGKIFLQKHNCIVIKEVYNSGGSGLAIIDTVDKLNKICEYIGATTNESSPIILEKWYDSMTSYNHQYVITDDGIMPYCFSKQVIENKSGRIKGSVFHNMNSAEKELWDKHYNMSYLLLDIIKKQGYRGLIGFDSIINQQENIFFPVIDINCRINLSTIFWEVLTTYFNSIYSLFICREYVLSHPVAFKRIQSLLGNNEYSKEKKEGIVILNFTSLNYNILNAKSKYGRIFYGIFAQTEKKLKELWLFVVSDAMTI